MATGARPPPRFPARRYLEPGNRLAGRVLPRKECTHLLGIKSACDHAFLWAKTVASALTTRVRRHGWREPCPEAQRRGRRVTGWCLKVLTDD